MRRRKSKKIGRGFEPAVIFRKYYKWITAVFAAAIILFAVKFFPSSDIRPDAAVVEQKVTQLLRARNLYEGNITSRIEQKWKKINVSGKTVEYAFRADADFKYAGLEKDIKKAIEGMKNTTLRKFVFKEDKKGKGTVNFFITCKGHVVFAAKIENIPPQKVPKGPLAKKEEVPSEEKPVIIPVSGPAIGAKLAIVLDDFGYTGKNFEALKRLDTPITIAILPNLPQSKAAYALAVQKGMDAILHLPLEPEKKVGLERGTILVSMNDETVRKIAGDNMDSLSGIKGVNNHMGSKATKDERVMRIIFNEIKKRGLFFLDSATTRESVCMRVARSMDITCLKRDIFIDNVANVEIISKALEKAADTAEVNGIAIAIGHDRPDTIKALLQTVPRLKQRGIQFVKLSDIAGER